MGAIQSDQNCRPPIQPADNLVNLGFPKDWSFCDPISKYTQSNWYGSIRYNIFHSKKQALHFQIHKNIEAKKCEDEADVVQQSIKVSNIEMHLSLKDTQCSIGSQDSSRCFQRQIFFFLKHK